MSGSLINGLARKIEGRGKILVLPEGTEERVLHAARYLQDRKLADVVLLGCVADIEVAAGDAGISLSCLTLLDPVRNEHLDAFAGQYGARWPDEKTEIARNLIKQPLYFAGSMLGAGLADAMLAGVANTTASVVRASLKTIGLADGVETASSCFLILRSSSGDCGTRTLIYADCAVVVDPSREQLVEIALASAATARDLLDEEPRVAFLSFSTKGSSDHAEPQKMRAAAALTASRAPDIAIDGELQADAALSDRVAQLKLDEPGPVAGRANVLIFPNLSAANIAYKLTQYLAGARAIGPILQGLAHPVADLSRGATVDDIITTAIVTLACRK